MPSRGNPPVSPASRRVPRLAILVITAAFIMPPCGCDQARGLSLAQVQVVTRHGARTALSKDAATLAEGGGSALTSAGEEQARDLGTQLRDAYLGSGSDRVEVGARDAGQFRVISSDSDRTIATAMAVSAAALPKSGPAAPANSTAALARPSALVPVHAVPEQDDIAIRAYKACPSFQEDLQELYTSSEFAEQRRANRPLLQALAEAFPDLAEARQPGEPAEVPLEHLWNVYDRVSVRAEGDGTSDAEAAAGFGLAGAMWQSTAFLAAWVEHRRFGRDTAGARLGANLWRDILARAGGPAPAYRYVHYSAHYPTLLGLMAALDLFSLNGAVLGPEEVGIPGYASALVVEVWRRPEDALQSDAAVLRVRFKDGHGGVASPPPALASAAYLNLGPACGSAAASWGLPDASFCPIPAMKAHIAADSLWPSTPGAWCEQCGNTMAAPCVRASSSATAVRDWGLFLGGLFLGAALASVVAGSVVWLCRRRHRATEDDGMDNPIMDPAAVPSASLEISNSVNASL